LRRDAFDGLLLIAFLLRLHRPEVICVFLALAAASASALMQILGSDDASLNRNEIRLFVHDAEVQTSHPAGALRHYRGRTPLRELKRGIDLNLAGVI
jgi:hypothetical protein